MIFLPRSLEMFHAGNAVSVGHWHPLREVTATVLSKFNISVRGKPCLARARGKYFELFPRKAASDKVLVKTQAAGKVPILIRGATAPKKGILFADYAAW